MPAYAYLTLNHAGSYAAAWRLPNTYTVIDRTIQQHSHTGKAKKIRRAVRDEIAPPEQRGCEGDTALLRSGSKRYFTNAGAYDSFRACGNYLRKLGRSNGDLSLRRYFCIGPRQGVKIYEAYNLHRDAQQTHLHQRLIWQEGRDDFAAIKESHRHALED